MDNKENLYSLLDRACEMAGHYTGGYCDQFLSAEAFHEELVQSVEKLKTGDETQLGRLYYWFMPSSCWDDFIGSEGMDLANEICEYIRLHPQQ